MPLIIVVGALVGVGLAPPGVLVLVKVAVGDPIVGVLVGVLVTVGVKVLVGVAVGPQLGN